MSNSKDPWGRRAKWIIKLEDYSFEVEYVVGDQSKVADVLSRLGFQKETDNIIPEREVSTMKSFAEEMPLRCASTMCESL